MSFDDYKGRVGRLSFLELKKEKRGLQDNIIMASEYLEKFPCEHWRKEIESNKQKLILVEKLMEKK